jgi:hypothetical protein
MNAAVQVKDQAAPAVCQRRVLATKARNGKTECIFADGTSILLSTSLGSFIRAGDQITFPLEMETAEASTQIYILSANSDEGRPDFFQAEIAYATQPRKDRRDNLFISTEVRGSRLGISTIHLRCETLRDYFYVGSRCCAWDRQPSLYELLRVNSRATTTEVRLAFRLRNLELRTAHSPTSDCRALERAFNILANPELRACYDTLLNDPSSPTLFPYGGFGSLLVAGNMSRDGPAFYASRILSFRPEQKLKHYHVPLRNVRFHNDHAIYQDSRRKLEVSFDRASLPLLWDASWNQWKHLLGAKVGIKATFIHSGRYRYRGDAWHLVKWETALPSRIEVALPTNIGEQVAQARETHHRFGQFAEALDQIRARIESTPIERAELQKMCVAFGIPGDFDVALVSWKPDYEAFYYRQLCKRARRLYLFRTEYIYDLETVVVVETPQLGHATYLFSKPANMLYFLAVYRNATKDDIRQNRGNVAERLGFMGRLIHGHNPAAWNKELRRRLGEPIDYAEASD